MFDRIDEIIDNRVSALETSLAEKQSLEVVKPILENLIEVLSEKLAINLKKIKEDDTSLSQEEIDIMQKEEVEQYKETVAYFAHYTDKQLSDKS